MEIIPIIGVILLSLLHSCTALYEDQAGKFDWRHQYIGHAKVVKVDGLKHTTAKLIVIGSEQNTVAALNARTGELSWRHVFERGSTGRIDDIIVEEQTVVVVFGGGTFVRAFRLTVGTLLWEVSLQTTTQKTAAKLLVTQKGEKGTVAVLTPTKVSAFQMDNGYLYWTNALPNAEGTIYSHIVLGSSGRLSVIGMVAGLQVVVLELNSDGVQKAQNSAPAVWLVSNTDCAIVGNEYLGCLEAATLHLLTLAQPSAFKSTFAQDLGFQSGQFISLDGSGTPDAKPVFAIRSGPQDVNVFTVIAGAPKVLWKVAGQSAVQVDPAGFVLSLTIKKKDTAEFKAFDIDSGKEVASLSTLISLPSNTGVPQRLHGFMFRHKDDTAAVRMLVIGEDHSLLQFQQNGQVGWVREEALASIVTVEMVDLPVSPILAELEEELSKGDDFLTLLVRRLTSQITQLHDFLLHLRQHLGSARDTHWQHAASEVELLDDDDEGDSTQEEREEYLTRDNFNIHKIIVAVTAPGKLFGLDSNTGRIIWRHLLPDMKPWHVLNKDILNLYIQRTTAHFPHLPQATIVGQHRSTGGGLIFSFNPISGEPVEGMEPRGSQLGYKILQLMPLPQMDPQSLHPIVLLDSDLIVHVYPESSRVTVGSLLSQLYLFTTHIAEGELRGYSLHENGDEIIAHQLWLLDMQHEAQTITSVTSKRRVEQVHSQGIVLGDRSVLYKYLNPNLVTVTTEGQDSQGKSFVNMYLVDTVSGQLVFHCGHRKASGPMYIVHSENWVVYSFWNQKQRRVEMAVIELYEGRKQSNATAFSSMYPPPPPLPMRQSYIFTSHVTAMAVTVTEKGITNKHVLMAMETGGILELPKALFDPRRPEVPTQEHREEGLIPYIPELPRPFEMIINYNQSVYNIRAIHTAPAGLESTCLVLAYGLDLFYTRVNPSKMFDVLKDDFDYFFISCVLFGMIMASIITQKLAARKALTRAWK